MNSYRIIMLFGVWLIVSLFCNDRTGIGSIRLGINIRPDRIVYAILLIEFVRQCRRSPSRVGWTKEEKWMLVFFLVLLASCVFSGTFNDPRNRYVSKLIGFGFVPATLFMISRRLHYDERSLRLLWMMLIAVGAYLGFTGFCERFGLGALVFPKYILDPAVGIHFGRVRGPFVHSVVMGGALITIGLWLLWYQVNVQKSWLAWVVLFLCLGATYYTFTRAVWLQLAASLLVLAVFYNPLRKPIRVLAVAVLAVYVLGIASKFSAYQTTLFKRRNEQVDDRINIYLASWRMFLEKPLLGFGYGNYEKYGARYFTNIEGVELRGQGEGQHHTILGLMCETGIVGTIPFCAIYFLFFRTCWRRFRDQEFPDGIWSSLALAELAILTGNLVSMQFSDFGFYPFVNSLIFWTVGMLYAPTEPELDESLATEAEAVDDAAFSSAG